MCILQEPNVGRLLRFASVIDDRGLLVALENGPNLPFEIQRLFYLVGMGGAPRGFHAHLQLQELLVCVAGSCLVTIDDGSTRQEYRLFEQDVGLYLAPMEWVEMKEFSQGCVLLVLASAPYDEADYIRDYATFLSLRLASS